MSLRSESRTFHLRRADWVRDGNALRLVRTRVFVEEQSVPGELEWDDDDARAIHLLAEDDASRPIGTARLVDTGQIGRMAVLPEWRDRKVGCALLREALNIACASDYPAPFLNAQVSALPFYQRMGFEPVGEQFDEAGIPHRRMILRA